MSLKINRSSDGTPGEVEVKVGGRTFKVSYDKSSGFTFDRKPSPEVLEYLSLVYPYTDSVVSEKTLEGKPFFFYRVQDPAGVNPGFSTSSAWTDQPDYLFSHAVPKNVEFGIIKRIHFKLNPTNAVTYQLRIWADASPDDYYANQFLLYESAAGLTANTQYDNRNLEVPFYLKRPGWMWFSLEWSGATGNIAGYIAVSGVCLRELTVDEKGNYEYW